MIFRRQVVAHAGCGCLAMPLIEFLAATRAAASTLDDTDAMRVLPPRDAHLDGYLERHIDLSIRNWAKGVVPYRHWPTSLRTVGLQTEFRLKYRFGENAK